MRINLCVVWFKDIFRVCTDQLKTPYGLKQNKQKWDNAEDRTELEPSIYRADDFGIPLRALSEKSHCWSTDFSLLLDL